MVHDVGEHEGRLFIVMELLHGQDLAAVLAATPAGLPLTEAVELALQAVAALVAAHRHGVVHRDLKPANLFLVTGGQLKVGDFGIARLAGATSGLTATGQVLGTPVYMSPEQWRGEQADERSDLYSLGCVIYAMLTGQPPFPPGQDPIVLMRQHLDVTPDPPSSRRYDIPAELSKLVVELLAKNPADRPSSADQVLTRLRAVQSRLSALTPPSRLAPTLITASPGTVDIRLRGVTRESETPIDAIHTVSGQDSYGITIALSVICGTGFYCICNAIGAAIASSAFQAGGLGVGNYIGMAFAVYLIGMLSIALDRIIIEELKSPPTLAIVILVDLCLCSFGFLIGRYYNYIPVLGHLALTFSHLAVFR